MFRVALFICVSVLTAMSQQQSQKPEEPDFPKTAEIKLVVAQSERAFEQYKQSVELESQLGAEKREKTGVNTDRELVEMADKIITGLKAHPDAFHGVGGLLLLSNLDDAARNAALCRSEGL